MADALRPNRKRMLPDQEHHAPVRCGVIGGFLIGVIGVLLPPVMFWGEFEINTLANPSRALPHIWPQAGIWGTGLFCGGQYSWWMYVLIGLVKLPAISITVLSGGTLCLFLTCLLVPRHTLYHVHSLNCEPPHNHSHAIFETSW